MSVGYTDPLYILAFDHRGTMRKRFGLTETSPEDLRKIEHSKNLIYDGVLRAIELGVPREAAGVLVDEEFGSSIPARAAKDGLQLAVSAEASGKVVFEFEYPDWQHHLEVLQPKMTKVLVRYNPDDPHDDRARQRDRLYTLSRFLRHAGIVFLLEMTVAPTDEQLASVGGDKARFAEEVRSELVARAIHEFQDSGVEADIWKVEGLRDVNGYRLIGEAARRGGRDGVGCLVLGAGAPTEEVERWLISAAREPAFTGFAVGRSIWWNEIGEWHASRLAEADAVERIARNYLSMVRVFADALTH